MKPDDDLITIKCAECGNQFDIPWDCMAFGMDNVQCGQCPAKGKWELVADPALPRETEEKVDE